MNEEQLEVEQEVEQNEVPVEDGSEGVDVLAPEDPVLGYQETVIAQDRPFYTTPFSEYSVVEGLLLLIFVILLVEFFLNLVRRWF